MVVLVDKSGKIVFIGHPRSRINIENDIRDLLMDIPLDTKKGDVATTAGGWEISGFTRDLIGMALFWIFWYFLSEKYGWFKKDSGGQFN